MPEPTLDLLTADGRQLMASVNPTWGEPEVFTERAYQKMAALRDAIVAAARSAPVGELTEAKERIERDGAAQREADALLVALRPCSLGGLTEGCQSCRTLTEASLRRMWDAARAVSRPSDAVLAEARREGWDAARAFANEKWGITPRPEHWDAERDRRWPAPPKPTPSPSAVLNGERWTRDGEPAFPWRTASGLFRDDREMALALAAQVAPERAK